MTTKEILIQKKVEEVFTRHNYRFYVTYYGKIEKEIKKEIKKEILNKLNLKGILHFHFKRNALSEYYIDIIYETKSIAKIRL